MKRGRCRLRRTSTALTALTLLALTGLLVAGLYIPYVASRVPFLAAPLRTLAPQLPAAVAWWHDPGTSSLRSGAYFGWSDGAQGELHLYGAGCSEGPTEPGSEITSLTLSGASGRLEFPAGAVQQLWTELDQVSAHPHIRVEVVTDRTLRFDRATIRCRDGTEASARVLATVLHVPAAELRWPEGTAPLTVDPVFANSLSLPPAAAPRAVIHGPSSLPTPGRLAEYTLVPAHEPLTLRSLIYAPARLATGRVTAAAGHWAALPYWRRDAVVPFGPASAATNLPPLTPWHSGYQAPSDPKALRLRAAEALALTAEPGEVSVLFLLPDAFRATPAPRPLLLKQVLEVEHAGHVGKVVASGLAFGWTAPP